MQSLECPEFVKESASDEQDVFISLWHCPRMLPPHQRAAKS